MGKAKHKPSVPDLTGQRIVDTVPASIAARLPEAVRERGVWGEPTYGEITDLWKDETPSDGAVVTLVVRDAEGNRLLTEDDVKALPMKVGFVLVRKAQYVEHHVLVDDDPEVEKPEGKPDVSSS